VTAFNEPENVGIDGDLESEGEEEEEEQEQEQEVELKQTHKINKNATNDKGNMGEEDVKQFLESQRRISKIKSVTNEREVRLIDVEGKPTKKSKISSNGHNKTASNSDDYSSSNKPIIPLTEIPEEGTPDRITKSDKQKQNMMKAQADRKRSTKKSFAMSGTSENSAVIKPNKCIEKIAKIQQKMWYKVLYFSIYYWLALNDHFRLIFIPKSGDIAFFIFTVMLLIVF
jgi:hypothetical protein